MRPKELRAILQVQVPASLVALVVWRTVLYEYEIVNMIQKKKKEVLKAYLDIQESQQSMTSRA
jgi:hypothetical protein